MKRSRVPPWYFVVPAVVVALGVLVPIGYLAVRAFDAEADALRELVWRRRNLELFTNTMVLAAAVIAVSTLVALPLAWLTTRTDLRGRFLVTLLSILPLSIPGYVVGYALLGVGSPHGPLASILGLAGPQISGFVGAAAALTIYNFPLVYLHLRTAFASVDPSLTEAARSLGLTPRRVFVRVTLPQLIPAYLSSALLVLLYVLGDFGVVSLMRFETFSYALYLQYIASLDRTYAAWLALMLLAITTTLVVVEFRLLRDLALERAGLGALPRARPRRLGAWAGAAYALVAVVSLACVVLPVWSIVYWMGQRGAWADPGELARSFVGSVSVSAPAALLATFLAVPLAYLSRRYASTLTHVLERSAYVGYATPALAFALGWVVVVLRTTPALYQTAALLIVAYTVHFLAQAIGPVRAGLHVATPRIEEAARSLGLNPVETFRRVTLPILRPGLVAAAILVFLSCVKELPLTIILAPLDFETLAVNVYALTAEAMFAEAAPYALAIVLLSAFLISVLFRRLGEEA
jgi:iron(III) transport system permease protein